MEHTKGKWEIDESPNICEYRIWANNEIVCSTGYLHRPSELPPKERKANARLIAAAPDLLEACKRALSGIKALKEHSSTAWSLLELDIEAAIAKAEPASCTAPESNTGNPRKP